MKLLKNRLFVFGVSFLFILGAIFFTVFSVYAPMQKLHDFNLRYGSKSEGKPCFDDLAFESTIKEICYQEAFNVLAKTDSIGLIINLKDSLVLLSLKGVIIHKANLKSISTDGFFSGLEICSYKNLFSVPLEITEQSASIEKEPVVIKKAPKTENDSTAVPYYPDTLKNKRIADIELNIQAGFMIYFHDGTDGYLDNSAKISTPGETWRNVKRLFVFKKPEYIPSIHLCIDKKDAISLYRALPRKAFVVFKM